MGSSARKEERWMKLIGTFDPFNETPLRNDGHSFSVRRQGQWKVSQTAGRGWIQRRRFESGFLGGEWFDLDTHRLDDTASEHS